MEETKEKVREYFPHDYFARTELKKILKELGQEGKGVYWDLVEMLYEQGGYLELAEIDTFAFDLRTSVETIKTLLRDDFRLFEKDKTHFWSNSIFKRLKKRKEISELRSIAGKKGVQAKLDKKREIPKHPPSEQKTKASEYKIFEGAKYIKITEKEYQKSVEKWGEPKTNKMVDILENWLECGTKKAKEVRNNPHYGYFRKDGWVSQKADEELKKEQVNNGNAISSNYGCY